MIYLITHTYLETNPILLKCFSKDVISEEYIALKMIFPIRLIDCRKDAIANNIRRGTSHHAEYNLLLFHIGTELDLFYSVLNVE